MNISAILSLLLITSSSVLCRNIERQDAENVDLEESPFDTSIIRDEKVQNFEEGTIIIDATTPEAEIRQENAAVYPSLELAGHTASDDQHKLNKPLSKRRFKKMLEKAILKIITGDLTTADMKLLKDLNYDAETVRRIREEELGKKKNVPIRGKKNDRNREDGLLGVNVKPKLERGSEDSSSKSRGTFDYEAFNNQATVDYEYAAENFEATHGSTDDLPEYEDGVRSSTEMLVVSGRSLKPQIVFTIKYNDSEFDSSSEENSRPTSEEMGQTSVNGTGNNFPTSVTSANSSPSPTDDQIDTFSELRNFTDSYFSTTENSIILEEDNEVDSQTIRPRNQNGDSNNLINGTEQPRGIVDGQKPLDRTENRLIISPNGATLSSTTEVPNVTSNSTSNENSTVKYKGLRWVQDNVYQVIPEYIDSLQMETESDITESSDDDAIYQNIEDAILRNPTIIEDFGADEEMQNDAPDSTQLPAADEHVNLTATYRRNNAARREIQKQKTEDEIKARVLIITGRHNATDNSHPLQPPRERLVMFSPTCGMPRNTDAELWQDPNAMNMLFQVNLTFDQHLVAAKLRLYKLPRENSTDTSTIDGVESNEKIRISVYYYTKSLRKHRLSKPRLVDSKVTSLTSTGEQLTLDVKDAVSHWRSIARNPNHGLLVQVEDQERRPLPPSNYIQRPNCENPTDPNLQDEKAYQRVPALFIRACTRYVRVVGNVRNTYEFCGTEPELLSFRK